MRFFETVLSGAALVAAALAVTIDTFPSSVVAGMTYTITYSPKDNTPTTFILRQGPSGNLNTVDTLTTTATGGSFTWTVPKTLPDQPNYAFQVKQGEDSNYSAQFPLTGGSAAVSSAASSAVSSARPSGSSAASYAMSSMTGSVTSMRPSASIMPSSGSNSTVSSATLSRASTMASSTTKAAASSGAASTSSAGAPQSSTGAGSMIAQPLAAVVGAFAAFAYLA